MILMAPLRMQADRQRTCRCSWPEILNVERKEGASRALLLCRGTLLPARDTNGLVDRVVCRIDIAQRAVAQATGLWHILRLG